MQVAHIKKIAILDRENKYLLKMCILALYSEWEGFIKSKVEELLKKCNEVNRSIFELKKEYFFSNRNLNNEEFKKLWKNIFDDEISNEKSINLENSFFRARNFYAHGNFSAVEMDWQNLENYLKNITNAAGYFSDKIDDMITKNKYIKK